MIVEGPDNAGKSTLVRSICEAFNLFEGQRSTANRDDLWKVTVADTHRALDAARFPRDPIVWDRLFFSEFVYSKYAGRPCEFSEIRKQRILQRLEDHRYPIILCLPPKHVVLKPSSRHQMEGVNENLESIYDDYVEMIDWMPKHTIIYNYMVEQAEDVVYPAIYQYLREKAR